MKVSELIKELTELDPKDECVLCINNHPVSMIERLPRFWDGRLEHVERDYRHIPIKAGYPNHGCKIVIHYDTIENALLDNPDLELDLSGITYQGKVEERYVNAIQKWKQQGYEFQEWKKNNAFACESGQKYEPKNGRRTRFTNLLRKWKLIDD